MLKYFMGTREQVPPPPPPHTHTLGRASLMLLKASENILNHIPNEEVYKQVKDDMGSHDDFLTTVKK